MISGNDRGSRFALPILVMVAGLSFVDAAGGQTPENAAVSAMLGCWRVEPGVWNPPLDPRKVPSRLPGEIRLESGPYAGTNRIHTPSRAGLYHVDTLDRRDSDPGWRFVDGVWESAEADSIRLLFTTGFHGYWLIVAPAGSVGERRPALLVGRVRALSDIIDGRSPGAAPVVLRRIPCPELFEEGR